MATSEKLALKNVRLSYPNLYDREKYQGEETKNWSATFILNKDEHADTIERIQELGMEVATEVFGKGKVPKKIWFTDKCAFRDGDDSENEEYENTYTLKAVSNKRVLTVDRAQNQVAQEDGEDQYNGIFYPGCYVDAIVSIWCAATYKHIRANLHVVQFRADGERLGNSEASANNASLLGMLDAHDDDVDV